jgi:4-hydroxybenzoate polyprenyltransferase
MLTIRGSRVFQKIKRLFVIKTPVEAYLIIYALALGACERGKIYLDIYPGFGGKLLFLACTGAVFMAGAKILDCLKHEQAAKAAVEV